MTKFKCLLIGPPGSGKGTIAKRIVDAFSMTHVCAGDIIRREIHDKTEVGEVAEEYISHGKLIPDYLIISLIEREVIKIPHCDWLLDGFPRTLVQAENLDQDVSLHAVINLNVPFKTIIERIKGRWYHPPSGRTYNTDFNPPKNQGVDDVTHEPLIQRPDDRPEAVKHRLMEYDDITKPVLHFYKNKDVLVEFKGTETNEIWPHVKSYVDEQLEKYHDERNAAQNLL